MTKLMANKPNRESAQQTFRQFTWNIAGTLAKTKPLAAKPVKG